MNKIIIYYPFPHRELKSGSAVRPVKMLEAFHKFSIKNEIDVIEITGNSEERKQKLMNLYQTIDPQEILFCYMENSTLPFWLTDKDHIPRHPLLDWSFFRYLKRNSIPLGLFYRDVYWRFKDYALTGVRRAIMKTIFRLELSIYKRYVNQLFLPSEKMNDYVGFDSNRVMELPPGGKDLISYNNKRTKNNCLNVIYVGGISKRYGVINMLEAIDKINNDHDITVNLLLVCRENEYYHYYHIIKPFLDAPWFKIFHKSGEQLQSIYQQADIAIIPRQRNVYNDFAVPVKLFEYITYGLPIVSTDCIAQADIVNKSQLGVVVEEDSTSLADGIKFFFDKENLYKFQRNVKNSLRNEHLWEHRAKKAYSQLSNMKLG